MENQQKSPIETSLKYGVILGLTTTVISIIFYILDMSMSKIPQYLGYAIGIIAIIIGIQQHRDKDLGGFISYGRGLGVGTLIALFASIITAIYTIVFFEFIDPSFIEKIAMMQEEEMIKKGMTDKEIEIGMKYAKMFMTPTMMAGTMLVMGSLLGFVVSLIASAFLKKEKKLV